MERAFTSGLALALVGRGIESLHSGQGKRFPECPPHLEHMLGYIIYLCFGNGEIFQVGAGISHSDHRCG